MLVAGGVKALNPAGFARQIDAYQWLPTQTTGTAALLLVVVELLLGAALLLQGRIGIEHGSLRSAAQ